MVESAMSYANMPRPSNRPSYPLSGLFHLAQCMDRGMHLSETCNKELPCLGLQVSFRNYTKEQELGDKEE